jgi:hypothetical protein
LLLASPAGISRAHEFEYVAQLSGSNESPPNASAASGTALVTLDLDVITMRVQASFTGLSGGATAAQVRGLTTTPLTGTAGVLSLNPTLPGFPLGATSGSYDQTIDLTQASGYTPEFITASGGMVSDALNALIFGMADGQTYFEIDSSAFPGGEIRGFLTPVPEPASACLLVAATGAAALLKRRGRRLPC